MVSDAQFKKAVRIINDLPKSGGIRQTQDQQLQVDVFSYSRVSVSADDTSFIAATSKLLRATIIPIDLVSCTTWQVLILADI